MQSARLITVNIPPMMTIITKVKSTIYPMTAFFERF